MRQGRRDTWVHRYILFNFILFKRLKWLLISLCMKIMIHNIEKQKLQLIHTTKNPKLCEKY